MGPPLGVPPTSQPPQIDPTPTTIPTSNPEINNNTYAATLSNTNLSSSSNYNQKQIFDSIKARKTTHNGMRAIIFKSEEYYGVMTANCRRTIVGRFSRIRPQIEKIRSKFNELFSLKGSVQIGAYDNFNVFIHFTNDEDFNQIWFKRGVEIHGLQMWFQKWSPDFKPEEDIPIVPVWVLLPGLPLHLHEGPFISQIVSEIGTPLACDIATKNRTRPSLAKVRVEVDLLKPLPYSLWVGMEEENSPLKGFEQKVEYEGVPKYCRNCKKLGHMLSECRVLERKKASETKQHVHSAKQLDEEKEPKVDKNENQEKKGKEKLQKGEVNVEGQGHSGGQTPINIDTAEVENRSILKRTKKKKAKRKTKKMLKKKPKVTFKPGPFHLLSTSKRISSRGENSKNSQSKTIMASSEESVHNKIIPSHNTRREEEEVDQQNGKVQNRNAPASPQESSSLPSQIKNKKGIDLVVELNIEGNEDQLEQVEHLQNDDKEEGELRYNLSPARQRCRGVDDPYQTQMKKVVDNYCLSPGKKTKVKSVPEKGRVNKKNF